MRGEIVKKDYKLLFILFIIQPIIDIITSLMTKYNYSAISVGALSRTLIMITLFIYILQYILVKKQNVIWLFICSFASIAAMFMTNFLLKEPFILYEELNFVLKTRDRKSTRLNSSHVAI